MNRRRCCVFLLLLLAAAPVAADSDAASAAYEAGDYASAMREWMAEADRGSAVAQFNIGLLHDQGYGVEVDREKAAEWYLLAADGGLPRAQFRIAERYENGDGIDKSWIKAIQWFTLAASQRVEGARKRRKKLAKQISAHDLSLADMHAREWKRKHKEK